MCTQYDYTLNMASGALLTTLPAWEPRPKQPQNARETADRQAAVAPYPSGRLQNRLIDLGAIGRRMP